MNIINTSIKSTILEILSQNERGLGIYSIAKQARVSVSEVWRQIPILVRYGLIVKENKGHSGKIKKYQINLDNPMIKPFQRLLEQYHEVNNFIDLSPQEACNQILKKYYVTGTYALKEQCWDVCYPDGFLLAVDPEEYPKAELLKNCFINRWNFILINKPIKDCEFYYDETEGINKASSEQSVADGIATYELDPNNVEILYYLLIEDLDWGKLYHFLKWQWGEFALYRVYYLFSLARLLGGVLYPANLFYPKTRCKVIDKTFMREAQNSCFRILLCNGIAQRQAW